MPISRWQETEQIQGVGIVEPLALNMAAQGMGNLIDAAGGAFNQALQARRQEQDEQKRRDLEIFAENLEGTDRRLRDTYAQDALSYDRQSDIHFQELVGTVPENIREDASHLARRARIRGGYDLSFDRTQADRALTYTRLMDDLSVQLDAEFDVAQTPEAAREAAQGFIDSHIEDLHPDDRENFVSTVLNAGTRAGMAIDEEQDTHLRNLRTSQFALDLDGDLQQLYTDFHLSQTEAPVMVPVFGPAGDEIEAATGGGLVPVGERLSNTLSNGRPRITPDEFDAQFRAMTAEHTSRISDYRIRNSVEAQANESRRNVILNMREQALQRTAALAEERYEAFAANDRVMFAEAGSQADAHYDRRQRAIDYMELNGFWDSSRAQQETMRLNQRHAEGTTAGMLSQVTSASIGSDTFGAIDDTLQQINAGTLEVRVGSNGETAPVSAIYNDRELAQFRRNMDNTVMRASAGVLQSVQEAGETFQYRLANAMGDLTLASTEQGRAAIRTGYSNVEGLNHRSGIDLVNDEGALNNHVEASLRVGVPTPALEDLMRNYQNYGTDEDPDFGREQAMDAFSRMDVEGVGRRMLGDMLSGSEFDYFDDVSSYTAAGIGLSDAIEIASNDLRENGGTPSASGRRRNDILETYTPADVDRLYAQDHRRRNRAALNPFSRTPEGQGPAPSGTWLGALNPWDNNWQPPRLSPEMRDAAATAMSALRRAYPDKDDGWISRRVFRNMSMMQPERPGDVPGLTFGAGEGRAVVGNSVEMHMTGGDDSHQAMRKAMDNMSATATPYVAAFTQRDILVMNEHVNDQADFQEHVDRGNIRYSMMGQDGMRLEIQTSEGIWETVNPRDPETGNFTPIPVRPNSEYVTSTEQWITGAQAWWNGEDAERATESYMNMMIPGAGAISRMTGATGFVNEVIDSPMVWMGEQIQKILRTNFETMREGQDAYIDPATGNLEPIHAGLGTNAALWSENPLMGPEAWGRIQNLVTHHGNRMFGGEGGRIDADSYEEQRRQAYMDIVHRNPTMPQEGENLNARVDQFLKDQMRPLLQSGVAPELMDAAAAGDLRRDFAGLEGNAASAFRLMIDGGQRWSEDELLQVFDRNGVDRHMVDEIVDSIISYQEDLDEEAE